MNKKRTLGMAAAILFHAVSAGAAGEFTPDEITVETLPPADPYRLYVSDVAISHMVDGRMHIVDGKTLEYDGVIGTGFTGLSTLSPDRSEIYVATTYLSRLNRGTRTDTVDIYDSHTLKLKTEIEIPPKHAQALPYKGTIAVTPDGRFILVQNATPASSIAVVDRRAEKHVAEIPTPGCWAILVAQSVSNRFTTVCGDGSLITVTLDEAGQPAEQQRSAPFFDPDADPVFVQTENEGDRYYFISFKGRMRVANLGGEVASFEPAWSLLDAAAEQAGWRPGGYQPMALNKETGRLYVAMHPDGKEGSHKTPAAEIWAFDVATQRRVERVEGNNAVALAVSRGAAPRLFAIDPLTAGLVSYDTAPALAVGKRVDGFGEAPILIETH